MKIKSADVGDVDGHLKTLEVQVQRPVLMSQSIFPMCTFSTSKKDENNFEAM